MRPTLSNCLVCFVLVASWLALAGCESSGNYVKPTIAVLTFDNRAGSPYRWDLGNGMKDVLVDRLMKTGRYHVIERPDINAVMREISLQNSGYTRPQDRAQIGQLKNVQYLIKGTITDFGQSAGGYGYGGNKNTKISGSASVASLGMTLYVIHVESGEIVASERISETVGAGNVDARTVYKDMSFGGGAYFRTPLGQATARAIDRAVSKVTDVVARTPWVPKIASLESDGSLIVTGGKERGVKAGHEFDVLGPTTVVRDPDTGDIIARRPGPLLGRIRIREVLATSAIADAVSGTPTQMPVGSACQRVP